jgi:hypothetical protein
MRIFTKKAFEFENEKTKEKVVTSPLAFHDVPDWVKGNDYFKMVKADGDAEIITDAKKEKKVVDDQQ